MQVSEQLGPAAIGGQAVAAGRGVNEVGRMMSLSVVFGNMDLHPMRRGADVTATGTEVGSHHRVGVLLQESAVGK